MQSHFNGIHRYSPTFANAIFFPQTFRVHLRQYWHTNGSQNWTCALPRPIDTWIAIFIANTFFIASHNAILPPKKTLTPVLWWLMHKWDLDLCSAENNEKWLITDNTVTDSAFYQQNWMHGQMILESWNFINLIQAWSRDSSSSMCIHFVTCSMMDELRKYSEYIHTRYRRNWVDEMSND